MTQKKKRTRPEPSPAARPIDLSTGASPVPASATPDAPPTHAADDAASPPAAGSWQALVQHLRDAQAIDDAQELELTRFFATRAAAIQARMPAIEAEYHARKESDGADAAFAWLRETKHAMQHEQQAATQRLLEGMGLPVPDTLA